MTNSRSMNVRQASVVLASQSPVDPQTIKHEVLVNASIIDPAWGLANEIGTPAFAVVQYNNGVTIQIDGNRCNFQEARNSDSRGDYLVHSLAKRYVEATRLVQYSALGLNWLVGVGVGDLEAWLRERTDKIIPGFRFGSVQMVNIYGQSTCNLTLRPDHANNLVMVDCNFHFQLEGSNQALASIDHWNRCQSILAESVLPLITGG